MPTREEQISQVEAALRRRFFPLVPKVVTPDRIAWTEEQHDTDRLSRSLAAYASCRLSVSTFTPGPMVELIDSFFT